MLKRLPLIPTLVVLAAVAVMLRLGFWQIDRMNEKAALLALYQQVVGRTDVLTEWRGTDSAIAYRRVSGECEPIGVPQLVAGRNSDDRLGYVAGQPCRLFGIDWGGSFVVVLGWTDRLSAVTWRGGAFTGTLVPTKKASVKQPDEVHQGYNNFDQMDYYIVADPPLAGLQANAKPDPNDIPNNHWSYAIQWFLFAAIALVIYALALRKRLAGTGAEG